MDYLRSAVSLVTGLSLLLASCNSPPHLQRVLTFTANETSDTHPSVLLMPPDIELDEHGLTGSTARVDWAAEARQKVEAIVRDILGRRGTMVNVFLATDAQLSAAQDSALAQQRALVRELADRSYYSGSRRLVIGARGWSIGPAARDLRQGSDARYALFLGLRDQYSSTERVVGQVALGVLFVAAIVLLGAPLTPPDLGDSRAFSLSRSGASGGYSSTSAVGGSGCPEQTGYASLIDLETGNLVWLNRISEGCSDLRDNDDLQRTLELLLSGFP
jgi:hypothetical protein